MTLTGNDSAIPAPQAAYSHILHREALQAGAEVSFDLTPGQDECRYIARALGLDELRKCRFSGRLAPLGQRDWRLVGQLGATVVQPCVVTLAPVTTRIDETVTRVFVAQAQAVPEEGSEVEMTDDADTDVLRDKIDLGALCVEAMALALPPYPRAPGAQLDTQHFAAPGIEPMDDEAARPFAGLAALKDKLGE